MLRRVFTAVGLVAALGTPARAQQPDSIVIPPTGDDVRRMEAERERAARERTRHEREIEKARQQLDRQRREYEAVLRRGSSSDVDAFAGAWKATSRSGEVWLRLVVENGVLREEAAASGEPWTRVDGRTLERRVDAQTTERLMLSADRMTLTKTRVGRRADGTAYEERETYTRRDMAGVAEKSRRDE